MPRASRWRSRAPVTRRWPPRRSDRCRRGHRQSVCALVCAARLRHRLPGSRSRPRRDALRRGLAIAQDSGNRANESHLAGVLCRRSRSNTAIRWRRSTTRLWPSATTTTRATPASSAAPLAVLSTFLDRLGRYEPAATIAGFAAEPPDDGGRSRNSTPPSPTSATSSGDQTYESLAREGAAMTTAAMVDLRLRPDRPGPSSTRTTTVSPWRL